jgi:hypothetical protein
MVASSETQTLPLFYKNIRALDRAQDGDLKIRQKPDFSFTATSNAIPLVTDEFPYAGADYPIVFAPGATPVPVAVVGLELDKNLMLEPRTKLWRDRCYIPAYIRRYPFILVEDPDTKQLVLCFEDEAKQLAPDGELPLFNGDNPSEFTKRTLDFCMALRQQGDVTESFVRALQERQLLQPSSVTVTLPQSGRSITMDGFLAIDLPRFQALSSSIIADWHRRDWLGLVHAHLQSGLRWQKLAEIAEAPQAG